ncbi:ribonuclease Z [Longibacter salinarum]|uniref:Ribonuclease Z n=1 Tax=Longibacter salinarum TaxID=1850348 RepID=A0A2A8CXF3_9BACT|nr:ribonuclease Z [Longibacter salinarum]PEN13419.1 ribonuclease Z [Longibacter salinarum]
MQTTVIPLGTAGAVPIRDRHLSAVAVERKGRMLLFDCGEGAQYRLLHAGLNRARVDAIFITHLHGDHIYGLPGLAATIGQLHRHEPITVIGPEGLNRFLSAAAGVSEQEMPYGLSVMELDPASTVDGAVVYETDEFVVTARPLQHRIPTVGYRLEEKPRRGRFHPERARELGVTDPRDFGRLHKGERVTMSDGHVVEPEQVVGPERPGISFAYCTDTRPCAGSRQLSRDVDLVIHDATFAHELQEQAVETGHSTAREAAEVARDAKARRLLLTHISARYESADQLVADARDVFPHTEAAIELKRYMLDPREKWAGN